MRYNTDNGVIEWNNGTSWKNITEEYLFHLPLVIM